MIGRLLGGVATSLLFSVFEAWLIGAHASAGVMVRDPYSFITCGSVYTCCHIRKKFYNHVSTYSMCLYDSPTWASPFHMPSMETPSLPSWRDRVLTRLPAMPNSTPYPKILDFTLVDTLDHSMSVSYP